MNSKSQTPNHSNKLFSSELNSRSIKAGDIDIEELYYKNRRLESKKKREIKETIFVDELLNNGLNKKEAYKKVYPNTLDKTASIKSTTMFNEPSVQSKLQKLLPTEEQDIKILRAALEAETPTTMSWKDKWKYLEMSLKLKGYLDDKPRNDIKIGLVVQR